MSSLLESLLSPGALTPRYQPLVAIQPSGAAVVYGAECLIRGPSGTNLERADVLFEYIRRKSAEVLMDRTCIRVALQAATALPRELRLSLNVHALTLGRDPGFPDYLAAEAGRAGIAPDRLTVEVVEHAPDRDLPDLRGALSAFRATGIKIAIDDLGSGAANFRMLIDLGPDCLKIDRYFVTGVQSDPRRRAVVRAVLMLAESMDAEVIGEGVETDAEAGCLRTLGVTLHQGYLYARPVSAADFPRQSSLPDPELAQSAAG